AALRRGAPHHEECSRWHQEMVLILRRLRSGRLEGRKSPDYFLGRRISPLARRRLDSFRHNRRGFWALWIFLAVFLLTLFAEFIANDRPVLVRFDGAWYFPVFVDYPETTFGGEFPTAADFRDPAVKKLIAAKGWMLWPLIPFSYGTINYD